MQPFRRHTGLTVALDRVNVDTDQIIPKQFLKRIERTGFGQYLFYDWRFTEDHRPDPTFELNAPRYAGATILLTGSNFGCGSSREHAVWALADYGIRVIIAPAFADIFYANCLNNGILAITLSDDAVAELMARDREIEGYTLTVDLERNTVTDGSARSWTFALDPFQRHRLLHGLDDIGLTLQHENAIAAYERATAGLTGSPVSSS